MAIDNLKKAALKILAGFALCSPLGLGLANTAFAQDRYVYQVTNQLLGVAFAAGFAHYTLTHEPRIGTLYHRESETTTLTLRQGVTYAIIGVCDEDCRDMDLMLYDDNGNRVRADMTPSRYPVVEITPRWTANFTVQSQMYQCSVSPCYYGLGVFAEY